MELQDKRRIIIEVDSPATAHEIAFLERELLAILKVDKIRIRVGKPPAPIVDARAAGTRTHPL